MTAPAVREEERRLLEEEARQVELQDPEEAARLAEINDPLRKPWRCSACGEEMPATFDMCWKCQKARQA